MSFISVKMRRAVLGLAGAAVLFSVATPGLAAASTAHQPKAKPTIVLVHGAWADGSSWEKVATRLHDEGYRVEVPPNPLTGVADDAAYLRNYLNTVSGPVVLVGHSYGGMVITNAALGDEQVKALVYVDAFIPDQDDTVLSLTSAKPGSVFATDPANVFDFVPYPGAPDGAAALYVKDSVYGKAFADREVPASKVAFLAASQRPLLSGVLGEKSGKPAWAEIPSWAVVGTKDAIIPAAEQVAMAKKAHAHIREVNAPHLSMVTDSAAVTSQILAAVKATD